MDQGKAAAFFVDAGDYAAVRLAAESLQADIGRVTGVKPELKLRGAPTGKTVVIAGTLGHSPLIDGLVKSGKINAGGLGGKWEAFEIATVANPMPGLEQALVIAGSDRRGTIYGLYEISKQMGVSPWYWWADVPVPHRDAVYIKAGTYVQGPPAVKYRGLFINDEDWGLHQWASTDV